MRKTKYHVKVTTQFKKDYKLALKRCLNVKLLEDVIAALAIWVRLSRRKTKITAFRERVGHRECHILPDWLLIYRIEGDVLALTLSRTGTHSDLFGL